MRKYAILILSNSCPDGYEYEYYTHLDKVINWAKGVNNIQEAKIFNTIEDAENELAKIKKYDNFGSIFHIIVSYEINY